MKTLPIVCTLTPGDLAAQRDALLPGLVERALERVERPDGFAWRFEARTDVLQAIAGAIDRERQCCAFLRFELTVEPGGGPVWLAVSGPAGTKELLAGLPPDQGEGERGKGAGKPLREQRPFWRDE
jgi:hypothetical protein